MNKFGRPDEEFSAVVFPFWVNRERPFGLKKWKVDEFFENLNTSKTSSSWYQTKELNSVAGLSLITLHEKQLGNQIERFEKYQIFTFK